MKQYPYTLQVLSIASESQQDNNGNYSGSAQDWETVSSCRDEANSGGRQVTLTDGSAYVFDSTIQLPLSCPDLQAGQSVQVLDGVTVRVVGTIRQFRREQMHCRAWV
ncbi:MULTISPECIES: hypothetical protein [unclassified Spirosoma]|uniref:hypothetical protein n=1 Tax=unclassified Spirosoma TaxID=2621999 RepID=UPI0009646C3D|nr:MULTISPECIES: hypothetical protein [unclassified Spirosoma]MBN8821276.1 hypothetical protein [Spirosoma sp.]OJW78065.1 MAG: hypothetical protein BGO59_29035 [Spirosoma sp. 48-14]